MLIVRKSHESVKKLREIEHNTNKKWTEVSIGKKIEALLSKIDLLTVSFVIEKLGRSMQLEKVIHWTTFFTEEWAWIGDWSTTISLLITLVPLRLDI